jgi:hypothetical protein
MNDRQLRQNLGNESFATAAKVLIVIHFLYGLVPLIYLNVGVRILSGAQPISQSAIPFDPTIMAWFTIVVSAMFTLVAWSAALTNVWLARWLSQGHHDKRVANAIFLNCLVVPYGTVFGVLCFANLNKTGSSNEI